MDILEIVQNIINDTLEIDDEIELTTRFKGDLGSEFIDELDLVIAIEEEFGVQIEDDLARNIENVGDLIEFLEDRI